MRQRLTIALALLTSGCFSVPSTLGQPCNVPTDCDGELTCVDGVCRGSDGGSTGVESSSSASEASSSATTSSSSGVDSESGSTTTGSECTSPPGVWFVDKDALGVGNGSSWADAFVDLQDALAVAVEGEQIWVASGIYSPAPPNGDPQASFVVPPGVALRGGFAGTECAHEERLRDVEENPTLLEGDLAGNDRWPNPEASSTDNSRHVVVLSDDTVLDRFTVRGGHADGATPDGGGVWIDAATDVVVIDTLFLRNAAAASGGGLFARTSTMTVNACRFEQNTAQVGGGMHLTTQSELTLLFTVFLGDTSASNGAAFAVTGNSNADVAFTYVDDCISGGDGGIFVGSGAHMEFDLIVLRGNQAERGAGVAMNAATANVRFGYASHNIAMAGGGVFDVRANSEVRLERTTAHDNTTGFGGGVVYCETSSLDALNTTLAYNAADAGGGAIGLADDCMATVRNSISWGNTSLNGNPDIEQATPTYVLTYSDTETGIAAGMLGNITIDPVLVFDMDDILLTDATSPCIDAADGSIAPLANLAGDLPMDDGNPDNNTGLGPPWADMGAYEVLPPPP